MKRILALSTIAIMGITVLVGCGNSNETDESASVNEGSSEVVSASAEVSEISVDYSAYDELLEEVTATLSGNGNEEWADRFSTVFSMGGTGGTVGYLRQDLDENGVEELILGENSNIAGFNGVIYDIYTIDNGELVHVLDGWERNRFYLCTNGRIANEASGGADYSVYQYYTFEGKEITIKETIEYNGEYDPDNPWFYTTKAIDELTEDDNDSIESITEDEANNIMGSYEYVALQFTPFTIDPMTQATNANSNPYVGTWKYTSINPPYSFILRIDADGSVVEEFYSEANYEDKGKEWYGTVDGNSILFTESDTEGAITQYYNITLLRDDVLEFRSGQNQNYVYDFVKEE